MKTGLLDKEEKKILIGKVIGMGIVVAIILGFMIYFLSMLKFDYALIKKLVSNNPESIVYLVAPLVFIAVYAWPNMHRLLKDISANQVMIDTAIVKKTSRGWFSRDWYVELEGHGKMTIPYKDVYILMPGKKIEFRMTPQSKIMLKVYNAFLALPQYCPNALDQVKVYQISRFSAKMGIFYNLSPSVNSIAS